MFEKDRLIAFTDAVIAVIITVMVLELKVPEASDTEASWSDLSHLQSLLLSYAISFFLLATYWNNHHHLMQVAPHVTSPIMWANMSLLFFLSLIPFATNWMGRNLSAPVPAAVYSVLNMICGLAYFLLQRLVMNELGPDSPMERAIGNDWKGKLSTALLGLSVPMALWVNVWVARALVIAVVLLWIAPDSRIEAVVAQSARAENNLVTVSQPLLIRVAQAQTSGQVLLN